MFDLCSAKGVWTTLVLVPMAVGAAFLEVLMAGCQFLRVLELMLFDDARWREKREKRLVI